MCVGLKLTLEMTFDMHPALDDKKWLEMDSIQGET